MYVRNYFSRVLILVFKCNIYRACEKLQYVFIVIYFVAYSTIFRIFYKYFWQISRASVPHELFTIQIYVTVQVQFLLASGCNYYE